MVETDPMPDGLFLIKREDRDTDTDTETEGKTSCKSGTEIEVMHLQAKEHKRLLMTTRSQEEASKDSSQKPSERAWPCQHLVLDFKPLELERVHFCCFQLPWWGAWYGSPGKPMQPPSAKWRWRRNSASLSLIPPLSLLLTYSLMGFHSNALNGTLGDVFPRNEGLWCLVRHFSTWPGKS